MKLTTSFTLAAFAASLAFASLPAHAQTAPPATLMKVHPKTAVPADRKDSEEEKSFPDQATVAAKSTFGTVPAAVVAKAKALDAHDMGPAAKLIGKPGSFQGVIAKVYKTPNNGIVILDFDQEYKTALTAVVQLDSYKAFPDLNTLMGKHVFVTGTFTNYKDRPEIPMSKPSQIRVIQ